MTSYIFAAGLLNFFILVLTGLMLAAVVFFKTRFASRAYAFVVLTISVFCIVGASMPAYEKYQLDRAQVAYCQSNPCCIGNTCSGAH